MSEEMIRAYTAREVGEERYSLSVKKKVGCLAIYLTQHWINCDLPLPRNIPMGVMEEELSVDGCMCYHKLVDATSETEMANSYIYNLCLELIRIASVGKVTRFYLLGSHNEVINYVNFKLGLIGIMHHIYEYDFSETGECFNDYFGAALGIGDSLNELTGIERDFATMGSHESVFPTVFRRVKE